MRVYDVNLTGSSAAEAGRSQEAQRTERAGATRTTGSGSGESSDRVEFSGTLGRLSQAMTAYGSQRASHVQALAAVYQSGNYRPDSAATSSGMVSEALATGGK